jgi:hypothetical protein
VLKVAARIGTNPNGTKCPGHNNATGLRLYYNAANRASRVESTIAAVPTDLFLRVVSAADVLSTAAPTGSTAAFRDSAALNFANGNPWKDVGAWSMTYQR